MPNDCISNNCMKSCTVKSKVLLWKNLTASGLGYEVGCIEMSSQQEAFVHAFGLMIKSSVGNYTSPNPWGLSSRVIGKTLNNSALRGDYKNSPLLCPFTDLPLSLKTTIIHER